MQTAAGSIQDRTANFEISNVGRHTAAVRQIAVQPGRTWRIPAPLVIGPGLTKKKTPSEHGFQPKNGVFEEFSKKVRK
jgi:hypothetical protein